MKTKSARFLFVAMLLYFLFVLLSFSSYAQPDYAFRNGSLIAGTDKLVGAKYRFNGVAAGIDATISIDFISPGISIATFDDNANGGFDEAFQPRLTANAKTGGYAEFTISFLRAGTNIPKNLPTVPACSIDVDGVVSGADSLLEWDEYMTPGAHSVDFDMIGTDLTLYMGTGSVKGRNKKAIDRTGIDTVYKQAMFQMYYTNINKFTVRIGIDNQNNYSVTRQRSVYFQRFNFNNSFLPVSNITSFKGVVQNNTAQLNWSMPSLHDAVLISIERSTNGVNFSSIGNVFMSDQDNASFNDNVSLPGTYYYRLKVTDQSGKVTYTNILVLKNGTGDKQTFKVFPSVISSYTTVSFNSTRKETTQLMLADNLGRVVLRQALDVQQGVNTALLNGLDRLPPGQYIVLLRGQDFSYNQKVIIPGK